jgi:MrcB-like, N-terminal domain
MPLRNLIADIREGWPEYRRRKVVSKDQLEYKLIVEDFPREIKQLLPTDSPYELQGSTGLGNITAAPWIATFDPSVTRSATQGFYLVYLFSVNLRKVYLSIAFGITQFETYFKNPRERQAKLLGAAKHLSTLLQTDRPLILGALDLAASSGSLHADYERSNIAAILYELDALPSDEQLADNYRYMLSVYSDLVRNPLLPDIQQLLEAQIDLSGLRLKAKPPVGTSLLSMRMGLLYISK